MCHNVPAKFMVGGVALVASRTNNLAFRSATVALVLSELLRGLEVLVAARTPALRNRLISCKLGKPSDGNMQLAA